MKLAEQVKIAPKAPAQMLRPPWTTNERVRARCTGCGDCISACPENILFEGRARTPIVNFNGGECTFCGRCATSCQHEVFIDVEEQPWDLSATIDQTCLLARGVACQTCTDACDVAALTYSYQGGRAGSIIVSDQLCTGCGACIGVCPTQSIQLTHNKVGQAR